MLRFKRYQRLPATTPNGNLILPIVSDASIANVEVGHGRFIPLVIVDTSERPDIDEMITAQAHFPSGDVTVRWGTLAKREDHFALILDFERPTECSAVVEFEIVKHGILVEYIMEASALYIQAGRAGDRVSHDFTRQKLLVEIPDVGVRPIWNKIFFDAMVKRARKDGIGRGKSREVARTYIAKLRELAQLRVKRPEAAR